MCQAGYAESVLTAYMRTVNAHKNADKTILKFSPESVSTSLRQACWVMFSADDILIFFLRKRGSKFHAKWRQFA